MDMRRGSPNDDLLHDFIQTQLGSVSVNDHSLLRCQYTWYPRLIFPQKVHYREDKKRKDFVQKPTAKVYLEIKGMKFTLSCYGAPQACILCAQLEY